MQSALDDGIWRLMLVPSGNTATNFQTKQGMGTLAMMQADIDLVAARMFSLESK
jgi:hypothetical protein